MTILGKYTKQPVEVEVYSIQFSQDFAVGDHITSTWQIIAPVTAVAWDLVTQTAPYTALLTDAGRILVVTASVTLPVGITDGYQLFVSNASQASGITVGSFPVPARGAIAVTRKAGVWVSEISSSSVLIDAGTDQRVRTFVTGGIAPTPYKVQVLVVTNEGRTLQDEFIVRLKEY